MAQIRPNQLERTLRDRVAGGAFFFFGDEDFLRDEAVSKVVAAYLDPATRDFNFDQPRGSDVAAVAPAPAPEYRVASAPDASSQGLAAQLEEVGVEVYPMPYGDVLYRNASYSAGSVHGSVLAE